jgi:hypothetical protein
MAMGLTGEITERNNDQDAKESRDTLFLLGGAAMMVFGAGLILSTPAARQYLGGLNIANMVGAIVPKDLQRYIRMSSI